METRDNDHNVSKETHYVSLYDISVLNPCSFTTEDNGPINKNPVSECECGVECNPSEFSLDLNKITEKIVVKYQGCNEKGFCYPLISKYLVINKGNISINKGT